jgi:hypothetical protein
MAKVNVVLCDSCNERVATRKCDFCGKDLCNFCGSGTDIRVGNQDLENINYCKDCSGKVRERIFSSITYNDKDLKEKIKKMILSHVQKKLMLDKLEDEK